MSRSNLVVVQRWRERRDSYRPAGETIRTADYDVAPIPDDSTPKAFVEEHHYSGSYPAARFRFGLFLRARLVGVAVLSHPCNDLVLTNTFKGVPATDAADLGRFVLLDEVPANGETWFLGRAFELLRREGLAGVVSFSDPEPRTSADNVVVFPGHVGTIYQAFNGAYLGRGTARTLRLLPNGRALPDRSLQKIRGRERGWHRVVELLVRHGAPALAGGDDVAAWLPGALRAATRKLRHPGNHRYAWGLTRAVRRQLESLPYPKRGAA